MVLLLTWTGPLQAVCLSGYVRDGNGVPVANVDLDFIDATTGEKLVTPSDNTDITGYYSVCVLPGVYHVAFAPRRGSRLLGTQIFDLDLRDNQSRQRDIVLETGIVVSGRVTDSLGAPVGDIDLDLDRLSGGRVYTGDDNSSPVDGSFWIVVPADSYRLRFDPLPGSGWRGLQIDTFVVAKDTVYDAVMHRGFNMIGDIRDSVGNGIPNVDFELKVETTGEKIFVSDNTTNVNGHYEVVVPAGTFELRLVPLAASKIVGSSHPGFTIEGDSSWSEVLYKGTLISATVVDEGGNPVEGVDLDFNVPGSAAKLFTPHDKTNVAGISINAVLPGTYDLEFDPPVGAPYDRVTLFTLNCENDTSVTVTIPEVTRVQVQGQVRNRRGEGLGQVELQARSAITGAKLFLQNNLTDQSGNFSVALPKGILDLYLVPSISSRCVATVVHELDINIDTALSPIELDSGIVVTCRVIETDGSVVEGADIDVNFAGEPGIVFTPFDRTNRDGRAELVLSPGRYDFHVSPPAGSDLISANSTGLELSGDSLLTFVLPTVSSETEDIVLFLSNFPNPFAVETTFHYELAEPTHARLNIFTVAGELIETLVDEDQPAGEYTVTWNCRNRDGAEIADGVYICLLNVNDSAKTRKIVRIR